MGTPEEIYQKPATLFAAGFIGTPSMNFLHLEASDGIVGDDSIRLPASVLSKNGSVVVGIRPGAFRLSDRTGALSGRVERNEFHGETRLVAIRNGRHEINVALPASSTVGEGEVVHLDVSVEDLHLFAPETGKRIIGQQREGRTIA